MSKSVYCHEKLKYRYMGKSTIPSYFWDRKQVKILIRKNQTRESKNQGYSQSGHPGQYARGLKNFCALVIFPRNI